MYCTVGHNKKNPTTVVTPATAGMIETMLATSGIPATIEMPALAVILAEVG